MIRNIIENFDNIIITTHINPDPDAIGSGLSLLLSLRKSFPSKGIYFYIKEPLVGLDFLNKIEEISVYNQKDNIKKLETDLLITVDLPLLERSGIDILYKKCINIDHHISNIYFGDTNIVDLEASSTCEIILDIIQKDSFYIDKEIAENIYAGIMSDTGNLVWGNIRPELYIMLSKLKKIGIDNYKISKKLFKEKSYSNLKLIGYALQNFVYIKDIDLVYFILTEEIMEYCSATENDKIGIIDYLGMYKDAKIFLLITEDKETKEIKGSLRSDFINVSDMASKFGGGGHIKAAGFKSKQSVDEIISLIIHFLKEREYLEI